MGFFFRRSSILGLLLLFLICLPSNATSLPQATPSQRHNGHSYMNRLLNFPFTWTSKKSRKNLNQWLDTHPKLLRNLQRYENEVVIRFNVSTSAHEAALRKAIDQMLIDVWDFTDNYTDIRIEARRIRPLMGILPPSLHDNHFVLIPDLARAVAATYPSDAPSHSIVQSSSNDWGITPTNDIPAPKKRGVDDIFFHDYQPLSVINTWMKLLDSMFRGRGLVRMVIIGKSYEGRDIPALRVGIPTSSAMPAGSKSPKDTILITGGMHGREWISPATVNYVAWSFIRSIDEDPMIVKILEHFDIVFVPVLNPDGYEYTWDVDRLWRKSRQRTKMQYCPGFDLDHAFGYRWDATQHQTEPCSESFGGYQPFEAVEAAQLADWAKNETDKGVKFVAYLDLHSYSQQVLYPYAYSCAVRPPNLENLQEVAMNLAKHMRLSNGEVYTTTSACEGAVASADNVANAERMRVEAGGGSAIDYIFHELGARYSYQIKLRDTGSYGFLLPSEYIIPTGEELYQAMKYLGDYLLGNNGHESWDDSRSGENPSKKNTPAAEENEDITELRRRRRRRCIGCT
ncbi:uncharacterized protein GGS22DRAFT_173554 [Annulohypoxylon maeteangense]|uniref:uncharacterized protein n=1 Tax=Annulohypoxylon maeteangense TaxID=1927788 RepID=UPI00200802CC|nr:uncharacterized protein GGS22DRAFT_173554 [Annulohypoxylon maeteangense]KAI0881180.1 hypothetical protein GGS22DRAFT_173554 [Annulohypoxylon maeteangense]